MRWKNFGPAPRVVAGEQRAAMGVETSHKIACASIAQLERPARDGQIIYMISAWRIATAEAHAP